MSSLWFMSYSIVVILKRLYSWMLIRHMNVLKHFILFYFLKSFFSLQIEDVFSSVTGHWLCSSVWLSCVRSACQNIISVPQPQHLIPSTHFCVKYPSFQCMHQIMQCQIAYQCLSCRHWNDKLQIPASRTDLLAFSDYICLVVSSAMRCAAPRKWKQKRTWKVFRNSKIFGVFVLAAWSSFPFSYLFFDIRALLFASP